MYPDHPDYGFFGEDISRRKAAGTTHMLKMVNT